MVTNYTCLSDIFNDIEASTEDGDDYYEDESAASDAELYVSSVYEKLVLSFCFRD